MRDKEAFHWWEKKAQGFTCQSLWKDECVSLLSNTLANTFLYLFNLFIHLKHGNRNQNNLYNSKCFVQMYQSAMSV